MNSNHNSSATTYISQGNNINIGQDLYEMVLMLNQKINTLENECKKNKVENSNLHKQMYQLNKAGISKFSKLNNQIVHLNNIIKEQKNQIFQQENQIFQLKNHTVQQENQIIQLKNHTFKLKSQIRQIQEDTRNEKKITEIKYKNRFNDIEKIITNLEQNYSIINREVSSYRTSKELLNTILCLLQKIINDISSLYKIQNINIADNDELRKKLKEIEAKVEEYSKRINDNDLSNIMFVGLNNLIKKLDEIKNQFNVQIKNLEYEIKILKQKYKEIQKIFISRKLIKIIIKYIIMNCIKYFTMEDKSCKLNYLEVKYSQLNSEDVMNIINSLIVKNRQINLTMLMEGGIDKKIELLYSLGNTMTLCDLIDIIDIDNKTKENIKTIMEISKLNDINIYYDIIGIDPELKEMLIELQKNINHQFIVNSNNNN